MKKVLILTFILLFQSFFTQQCNCDKKPLLKNIISCKPEILKNGAQIFWQYNCDSSWLVFQNKKIKKILFSLDKDFMDLTTRLGYSNIEECKSTFLAEYRTISGCCEPSEYILHNKNNADIIGKLGSFLYRHKTKHNTPFILTLQNFTTILYTDLNTNKIYPYHIEKGLLEKVMSQNNYLTIDNIFDKIEIHDNVILLQYKVLNKNNKFENRSIKINLKNSHATS
ncbi:MULTISPECIES: hypothetical protein [unclassified Chryseobacterium]|uniref:hypothetical protein n=1 Tax=unclassified Chryseobacterium TaxID=2593645 RepID=UPI002269B070|nr:MULTISPECIES: hypothetical protein [unclassified Chryseobacterium]